LRGARACVFVRWWAKTWWRGRCGQIAASQSRRRRAMRDSRRGRDKSMLQEGARASLLPLSSRAKIESTFWALHAWGIESSDERHSPSLPPLRAALRYRTPPHVLHSFLSRNIFFILLHIHNIHIKFLVQLSPRLRVPLKSFYAINAFPKN
jgi:hypothetical protein